MVINAVTGYGAHDRFRCVVNRRKRVALVAANKNAYYQRTRAGAVSVYTTDTFSALTSVSQNAATTVGVHKTRLETRKIIDVNSREIIDNAQVITLYVVVEITAVSLKTLHEYQK